MTEETNEIIIPQSVGKILRSVREEKGLAIDAIAKTLCISKRLLYSLEEDSDALVCDVYTLGFLRSYALFLELDAVAIVQKFKDQAASPQSPRLSFSAPLPGRGMPSFWILSLSLGILLMLFAGWEWYGYQGPASLPKGENIVVSEALTIPSPKIEVAVESYEPPLQKLVPELSKTLEDVVAMTAQESVLLTINEETWIEVKDSKGEIIVSRLFHPGETYEFKEPKDLALKTGNSKGIQLSFGEKIYKLQGKKNEVKSDIPLDPEKWIE